MEISRLEEAKMITLGMIDVTEAWIDELCKANKVKDLNEVSYEALFNEIEEAKGTLDNCKITGDSFGVSCNKYYIEILEKTLASNIDINKYNTRVRKAMSNEYVKCSERLEEARKELDSICMKLSDEYKTISHIEYEALTTRQKSLMSKIDGLILERNTWEKAREICLNIIDEMENE